MINKLRAIKNILFNKNDLENQNIWGPFNCPVCGSSNIKMNPLPIHYFKNFQQHQFIHNIFYTETTNFEHYTCAKCDASDRDRLYALYLDQYFKQNKFKIKLLDIAPAKALAAFIKKFNVIYRSADLMLEDADDKVDITDMNIY